MMKKLIFAAVSAVVFSACQDDMDNKVKNPVQFGDEILFGASQTAANEAGSRTEYGNADKYGLPIYWKTDGTDHIMIYCEEAAQTKMVEYSVKPKNGNGEDADGLITKVKSDEAGLQWGGAEDHHFYAFYPATAVHKIENGIVEGSILTSQTPIEWEETEDKESGVKVYTGKPNMNYAYMTAKTDIKMNEVAEGASVPLKFEPLVTVLDLTVTAGTDCSVSSLVITTPAEYGIAGDFSYNMNTGICTVDDKTVTNQISISTWKNNESGDPEPIYLHSGEKINVKAFLLPTGEKNSSYSGSNISVRVVGVNQDNNSYGPKTMVLNQNTIERSKVNKATLEGFTPGKSNRWMTSMDQNIYFSELSIPGSYASYSIMEDGSLGNGDGGATLPPYKWAYNSSNRNTIQVYQSISVGEQFNAGVRAFTLQMRRLGFSNEDPLRVCSNASNDLGTLTQVLTNFSGRLDALNGDDGKEFVILNIEYRQMNDDAYETDECKWTWLEDVLAEVQEWNGEHKGKIFTGQLGTETKLDDLKKQIVLFINYPGDTNSSNFRRIIREYSGLCTVLGGARYDDTSYEPLNSVDVEQPYWIDPVGNSRITFRVQKLLRTQNNKNGIIWPYQYTLDGNGNKQQEGVGRYKQHLDRDNDRIQKKQQMIENLFRYTQETNKPNEWYSNMLGGFCVTSDDESQRCDHGFGGDTPYHAQLMNEFAYKLLRSRDLTAPLGMVFMNFAGVHTVDISGLGNQVNGTTTVYGDYMVQTLIDNNFKFPLRKATN